MVDVVSADTRSRMMSGIRSKGTKPEMVVRRALFAAGYRFRLHRRDLPGVPDVALPGRRVAIFVHGCFWHMHAGCMNAKLPATRTDFWQAKLESNVDRDRCAVEALRSAGWRVLVVWECSTRDSTAVVALPVLLATWIESGALLGAISRAKPG